MANLQQIKFWPLLDIKSSFPLNILRMNGQNVTKFCIHINIDNILVGIVKHNFCTFASEVLHLIDVRISFPLNILRIDGQNLTKFFMHVIIGEIYVGIVKLHFLCQNFVSALYILRMKGQD